MKFFKKTKGITLVALVVTIIILLILAGITISQLTGNGLFEKVQLAKEKYENAAAKETEYLESLSNLSVGTSVNGDRDTITMSRTELINLIKEYSNPVGTIISQMGKTAPDGYIKCEGQWLDTTGEYKPLADYILAQFGSYDYFKIGDEETQSGKFKVPDLRGEFLRGTGTNQHTNQGNGDTIGVHQDATSFPYIYCYSNGDLYISQATAVNNFDSTFGTSIWNSLGAQGGSGTASGYESRTIRPTNTSVLYCIKYK